MSLRPFVTHCELVAQGAYLDDRSIMTLPSPTQERPKLQPGFFPKNKPISSICLDERSILLFNG
jgi:hypothetical protein